ncbi:MAG: SHOCT domain-containing protein [Chloroflexi bacterium]|nr:SHOCT domain-containing protein [Chloroflexota bacterium]
MEATPPSPILGTPLADLERLRSQGMISDEEYERKRKELGAS